ncbi:MAG: PucR family transcriptional regulator [Acidimicrobiia bacterium]
MAVARGGMRASLVSLPLRRDRDADAAEQREFETLAYHMGADQLGEADPADLTSLVERLSRLLFRDQREFFLDLVSQRSPGCLVLHGRRLGHDLEQPHWPVVFSPRVDSARPSVSAVETLVRDVARASRPGPLPIVGSDGEVVVAFLPEPGVPERGGPAPGMAAGSHQEPPDAAPAAFARRVLAWGREVGLELKAGWGPRCESLDGYAEGLGRARWVVDVLGVLDGDPALGSFESLGIYGLLYDKGDKDQLWAFARRTLGPLLDHDTAHGHELTRSLRALLDKGGPSAAAASLYVHISTLKYRIRKIESILDVDLSDPETSFNVRLAFKILDVHDRFAARGRSS